MDNLQAMILQMLICNMQTCPVQTLMDLSSIMQTFGVQMHKHLMLETWLMCHVMEIRFVLSNNFIMRKNMSIIYKLTSKTKFHSYKLESENDLFTCILDYRGSNTTTIFQI